MPLLILVLVIGFFAYAYWARRGSTLRRECRWRLDRRQGPQHWHCVVCGAQLESAAAPRLCLKDQQ